MLLRSLVFGTFTLYKGHLKMSRELESFQNRKSAAALIVLKAKTIGQVVQISIEMKHFGILLSVKLSLGSPGEFRENTNFLVPRSSSCLTVS